MDCKQLVEVVPEKICDVLLALKRYWPSSIHIYYFIWMNLQWKDRNPRLKSIKVFHYRSLKEELFLVVTNYQTPDVLVQRVMVHSLLNDVNLMKNLLAETDAINWSENPMFEAVLEKDVLGIEEVCKLKNKLCFSDGFFNQVYLPSGRQQEIEIRVPPDMYISELTEEHVARVNDTWSYKFPGSDIIVGDTIVINHGLGLFRKSNNKLVAWNTVQHFAGLGMLYTEDDERGKGYGSLITLALAKYLVDKGIDPYACIRVNNAPSLAVYNKLGFEVTDKVTWITSKGMDNVKKE